MVTEDLFKYIRAQRVQGKDDPAIRQELEKAGWASADVDRAFVELSSAPMPPHSVEAPVDPASQNKFAALTVVYKKLTPLMRNKKMVFLAVIITMLFIGLVVGVPVVSKLLLNLGSGGAGSKPKEQTLKPEQLAIFFKKAINTKELEYSGTAVADYSGCALRQTFKGVIYGENMYAQVKKEYKDPISIDGCVKNGIAQGYEETYWIDEDIYFRLFETAGLEKIVDPTAYVPERPTTFLTKLFGENEKVEIVSSELVDGKIKAQITMTTKSATQKLDIAVAQNDGSIESISYTLNPKDFPQGQAETQGVITFKKFTTPVALPPFIPTESDFLIDSFVDISSYSPLRYAVNTGDYKLFDDGVVMDGEGAIKLIRGNGGEVSLNCSLNDARCQVKYAELREIFNLLTPFITGAGPVACDNKKLPEGTQSQTYNGVLTLHLYNPNRNGVDLQDYSLFALVRVAGDAKNSYEIRVKVGTQYCFSGTADDQTIVNISDALNTFQGSLDAVVATPAPAESLDTELPLE